MQAEPVIIQQGSRKAVIDGCWLSLRKLHNKKRDTGVWPARPVPDNVARYAYALAWVVKGCVDDDFVKL